MPKSVRHALLAPPPFPLVMGVDEAGRGCWAGPVVAGAVVWGQAVEGLDDSKKLRAAQRAALVPLIQQAAMAWGVGEASAEEIDRLNILQATFLAMERAVDAALAQLGSRSGGQAWFDGNRLPRWQKPGWSFQAFVGGDASHAPIAAASILAKEHRDGLMIALDRDYPDYGFARHKSYGTAEHQRALLAHGPCPAHRRSFRPVRLALATRNGAR